MKKSIVILLLSLGVFSTANAQFATQSIYMGEWPQALAATADKQSNVIVAGRLNLPTGNRSIVAKYAPDGTLAWTGQIVAPTNIAGRAVSTDSLGNVYVAGWSYSTNNTSQQLLGGPVWTGQGTDVMLAKYSSSGNLLWSQFYNAPGDLWIFSLECNASGDFVIGGYTNGVVQFGSTPTIQDSTGFVVKFNSAGQALWSLSVPEYVYDLSLDAADNIYITGNFYSSLTIGSLTVTSNAIASHEAFIGKISPQGTPTWLRASGGNQVHTVRAESITTMANGKTFVLGSYWNGSTAFDGFPLPSPLQTNGFVVCYSATGVVEWAKPIGGGGIYPSSIEADNQGNTLIGGDFMDNAVFGAFALSNPGVGIAFLSRLDSLGQFTWAIHASGGNSQQVKDIVLAPNGNYYVAGHIFNDTSEPFSFGGLTTANNGGYLYEFTSGTDFNQLGGTLFYDLNSNGLKDPVEAVIPGKVVKINTSFTGTGTTGKYSALANFGNHVVTVPSPPLYYSVVPSSHSVLFNGFGNTDTTRHFALQPIPNQQDLRIIFTPLTYPRPGYAYNVQVTCQNVGTVGMSGSVELTLDSLLTFLQSTPVQTSQNSNILSWSFSNLQPMQSAVIEIETLVPATANLGDTLNLSSVILPLSGDLTPVNNSEVISALVVGSFDPNDKQVSKNLLSQTEISVGRFLEYTIRFQNTGTDTAFTIRLVDTLDAQLNIPTFEMLASSHNYTWSIRDNGIMEWGFDNILLPDSNTNEAASHGFVKYRIKPNTNLSLGSVIRNTAAIYFDFNAPVITNTTTTEVALVSAVADEYKPQLQVFPNPNKGAFIVALQKVQEQSLKAELRNVLGQVVWQRNLTAENGNVQQQIKTTDLSKGIYLLQISTGKGIAVQKVVID